MKATLQYKYGSYGLVDANTQEVIEGGFESSNDAYLYSLENDIEIVGEN